ncbi:MAG: hypothetical protein ACRDOX_08175 [Nocardioides sp.]
MVSLLGVAIALTAGCGADVPPPDVQPSPVHSPTTTAHPPYDVRREPAEAALALVPGSATTVTVTDFDEIRKDLGVPDLTSEDPVSDRFGFWERARTEAPLLAEGMLRADNSELLLDYGFTQDDVDWEAHFTSSDGNGYIVAFRPDLDLGAVSRAVEAGAGPFDGARVIEQDHLVVAGTAEAGEGVWASDPTWTGLVGEPAEATYLRRGCIPLNDALGPDAGAAEQQDLLAKHPVTNLDDLAGFTVAFGDHNAVVRMEPNRDDLFDRIDLGRDWPVPGFGSAFRSGVGDPGSGRIGYGVPRPAQAAAMTLLEELPFAVCNEVTPIAEPTGL